jgi:hypothetical protein
VAGDPRTPAERREHDRQYQSEYYGDSGLGEFWFRIGHFEVSLDSVDPRLDFLAGRLDSLTIAATGRSVRVRGVGPPATGIIQELGPGRGSSTNPRTDSLDWRRFDSWIYLRGGDTVQVIGAVPAPVRPRGLLTPRRIDVEPGVAGRGARGGGSGADDAIAGPYSTGWSGARDGPLFNLAPGLEERSPGRSGIIGLASGSLASADMYMFPAGELAPHFVKIMVVHLRPGTAWKGR